MITQQVIAIARSKSGHSGAPSPSTHSPVVTKSLLDKCPGLPAFRFGHHDRDGVCASLLDRAKAADCFKTPAAENLALSGHVAEIGKPAAGRTTCSLHVRSS